MHDTLAIICILFVFIQFFLSLKGVCFCLSFSSLSLLSGMRLRGKTKSPGTGKKVVASAGPKVGWVNIDLLFSFQVSVLSLLFPSPSIFFFFFFLLLILFCVLCSSLVLRSTTVATAFLV